MSDQSFMLRYPRNIEIVLDVYPGHFTTSNSHVSHYLDMSMLKSNSWSAKNVARELSGKYLSGKVVDTIVCMEGMEIVGAYLAEELAKHGSMLMHKEHKIHVITPSSNVSGQLMFYPGKQKMIAGQNVLLLVALAASGSTINRALECLRYYSGALIGISAIFSAAPELLGQQIQALFYANDIVGYQVSQPSACDMCREGRKLDGIINSEGYIRI